MRRSILVLSAALLFFVPSSNVHPRTLSPLQLLDSNIAASGQFDPNEPIALAFNRDLDCSTAADALLIIPEMSGTTVCNGNQLRFTPDQPLPDAARHTLRIRSTLKAADGGALAASVDLAIMTANYLRISEVLPAGGTDEVSVDSTITVVFDRPVVPLTSVEQMDDLPQPVRTQPQIEGEGEWVNTFVYTFTPTQALPHGQTITLWIDEDLTAVDGAELAAPYEWQITTAELRLTRIRLDRETMYRLDPRIILYFNAPVDQNAIAGRISLRPVQNLEIADINSPPVTGITTLAEGEGALDWSALVTGNPIPGTFEWIGQGDIAYFTPSEQLANEMVYLVEIEGDPDNASAATTSLADGTRWLFHTLPFPELITSNPADGEEVAAYAGFTLQFNTFMNAESIDERLTIDPEPPYVTSFRQNMQYHAMYQAVGSTTYTVSIAPGIEDIYGNVYDQPIEFSYTTLPYPPQFDLRVPYGPVGFYNAYNDFTGLFVRHRNINRLATQLYTIPIEDFPTLLLTTEPNRSLYRYVPEQSRLLREWRVDLPNYLDTTLPTLVTLGEAGACPGQQLDLNVGDIVALQGEGTFEALSYPVDGLPVMQLYEGFELPVVGGPMCAGDAIWWQVEIGETRGWLAEGGDEVLNLVLVERALETEISLGDRDDTLEPGIYYLRMIMDDPAPPESYARSHIMMVMTANLTLKASDNELTVWATDVQTGEPIPNAPVTVYDVRGVIAAGLTDDDGLLTVPMRINDNIIDNGRVAILQSDRHFGIGMTGWANGIDPGMFGERAAFSTQPYTAVVYTDRLVYRPGETVYFRGAIRHREDVTYTLPTTIDTVTIQINTGQETISQEIELSPFGTFSGEYVLSADARLQRNSIQVAIEDLDEPDELVILVYDSYTVSEYRLPEFAVTLTPPATDVAQGEPVQIDASGSYYSGGMVTSGVVDYRFIANPFYFRYTGRERYNFYDRSASFDPYSSGYTREIATGQITENMDGIFTFELPSDLGTEAESQQLLIEATMRDASNLSVTARTAVIVHAGQWYIGTRPERYVSTTGEDATVNMIVVDWDSVGVPDVPVEVAVLHMRWNNVQERDPISGQTAWIWELEEIPVAEGTISTDDDGKGAFSFVPETAGAYRITFTTRDPLGNLIDQTAQVWISGRNYAAWRVQNNNRIALIADQDEYAVGDTAEILITSPFQGTAHALITVERYGILSTEVVQMETNSHILRLPITDDMVPNIFVSVMVVKGVDEYNPVPAFRMGILRILVSTEQRRITVEIDASTDSAQPGDTVTYTLRTADYRDQPVQAEIGVALTDAAALALVTYPDGGYPIASENNLLMNAFYSAQGLGIRTSTPLTINTDQVTQDILDAVKGGGGGGSSPSVFFDVRSDFISTTYWQANLETNADGEATFDVTLPDNLTTWTLNAYALTDGADSPLLVGQTSYDIVSTRPVLIRPVTPRFFVVGDRLALAAVVNNNSGETIVADVVLEAEGVTLETSATQRIEIPADEQMRVEWPVIVGDTETVELIFSVRSEDGRYTDASRPQVGVGNDRLLPVYRYTAPETVGTSGMLRDEAVRTEAIMLPQEIPVTSGELQIRLETSLAEVLLEALDYREVRRTESIEATISRMLPNIMTHAALDRLGITDLELEAGLSEAVYDAIGRIYAQQKADGGWGWYLREESSVLTTAYAVLALSESRDQRIGIDEDVIERGTRYLQVNLVPVNINQADWVLNRQAFVLYALARAGSPDIAATANLFDFRERLNLDARAFLALALHRIDPTTTIRTDAIIADFSSLAVMSATGTHWEETRYDYWNWSTDTRTTAVALAMFVELQPDSELIPNIVRWLIVQRLPYRWASTQETAWSVMALSTWMQNDDQLNPDFAYEVWFNDDRLASQQADENSFRNTLQLTMPVSEMRADSTNEFVIGRTEGTGSLFYTAHLRIDLPVPAIEPLNRGIIVDRRYTRSDEDIPVTNGEVGELIEVHLTIIAPTNLRYVTIEDFYPAGAEAIDPQLSTNQTLGTRPTFWRNENRYGWGWWWFGSIQFMDERMQLAASYLPAGTYEFVYQIRLEMPGTYNVIPTVAQETYFPEVHGRGSGMAFTILPPANTP